MKKNILYFTISFFLMSFFVTKPVFARCAVCVVDGMSGASIAVLVIISVFILLAIANWGLKKFLKKY